MKNRILLLKKEGETPLAALGRFRAKNKKYRDVKMTYAGRLDPMASGLLLVLAGEEVKNKEKYLTLDKVYEFEILFGFATDTHDILGKIVSVSAPRGFAEKEIREILKHFRGTITQAYPRYSSKTVKGKPLWLYAREGIDVEAPARYVTVKKLTFFKRRKITGRKLLENIEKRIRRVQGDFRQEEISKIWRRNLKEKDKFYIAKFDIQCSSGTYVRGLTHSLGERLGILALAYSIKRTQIGRWKV